MKFSRYPVIHGVVVVIVLVLYVFGLSHACSDKIPLQFLGFFPTSDRGMRILRAAEYAIQRLNDDPHVLNCFDIKLLPAFVQSTDADDPTQVFEILHKQYNDQPIHGIIGPYYSTTARLVSFIFGMHLDTLQISYAVTDPVLQDTDKYPLLYATVPTDILLNKARVNLLKHFGWERVCIISSDLTHHISTSQNLYNELRDTHNETVLLRTFVRGSANALLTDVKNQDLRIFIAIIKESSARNLICQAYNKGLATARHVWILPGMADPQWWSVNATISNNEDYNCTDEEMLSAINSTIFIDTLQFNTFQDNFQLIDEIYCHVFNQTNECSTELEDIDLHHFLHSKILNAFDATTALALAWNFTQYNYTMDELKVLLAQSWKTRTQSHMELVKNLQYNLVNVTSPFNGTASIYEFGKDQNSFGSAMITQFDGTSECILWSYYNGSLDTCNLDICCNATWKGGYQPDDKTCSNGTCTCRADLSNTDIATIVVMIIVFAVGVVATIPLQYINYWLRKNKYFKSSSPIFNAIITFGCSLQYMCGLLYIANYYIGITGYNRNSLVPLCNAVATQCMSQQEIVLMQSLQITVCFFWLPMVVINSTIFMKNWRIFRIFYNRSQKQIDGLSNKFIALGILLFTAPAVLMLIAIFSASHFKAESYYFLSSCPNITITDVDTFIVEEHCIELIGLHWDGLVASYTFIIFIGITILGCFNCKIPSPYQIEGQLAIFTGSISLILFFTFYAVALFFTNGNQEPARIQSHMPFATGFQWLYTSFILTALYFSKVIATLRDKKIKAQIHTKNSTAYGEKIVSLHNEIYDLKASLRTTESKIAVIKNSNSTIV